jgi:hypothetical protein
VERAGDVSRSEAEIVELLRDLVHVESLNEWEKTAFPSMLEQVESGRPLSQKQLEAVSGAADRLQLTVKAENLFSKLPPARQQEHLKAARKVLLPWETGQMARPLRPPGKP